MSNTSGLSPWGSPIIDTGTGAYEGPPETVTYGAEHDPKPTGLGDGPPESVTVESPPEHLSEPTNAHPGPPESVSAYGWPATAPKPARQRAKAVSAAEVEDKAITRKRG